MRIKNSILCIPTFFQHKSPETASFPIQIPARAGGWPRLRAAADSPVSPPASSGPNRRRALTGGAVPRLITCPSQRLATAGSALPLASSGSHPPRPGKLSWRQAQTVQPGAVTSSPFSAAEGGNMAGWLRVACRLQHRPGLRVCPRPGAGLIEYPGPGPPGRGHDPGSRPSAGGRLAGSGAALAARPPALVGTGARSAVSREPGPV